MMPFLDKINLHVEGRISAQDAARQERTARAILARYETQPGVVLADEVGMGKTFVALAVAVSAHMADPKRRPAVVMVPPSLQPKWKSDFELFREKCLPPDIAKRVTCAAAENAESFLKALDSRSQQRHALLFVTHGAMSRGLSDPFVKTAIVRRALFRRKNTSRLYNALGRCMGQLVRAEWLNSHGDLWHQLLDAEPTFWPRIVKSQLAATNRWTDSPVDAVVPLSVLDTLHEMDLSELYNQLWDEVPQKHNDSYKERLGQARQSLNDSMKRVWRECLKRLHIRLPLLVLDEAHHLKNAQTRLASLFSTAEAAEDADELSRGELAGVFDRMLFLTATPFQLGHHELCCVLERFEGIAWTGSREPTGGRHNFRNAMSELRSTLDRAQEAALRLDASWGTLRHEDIQIPVGCDKDDWWQKVLVGGQASGPLVPVAETLSQTRKCLLEAQRTLEPWVIRHLKPRNLPPPLEQLPRRHRLPGAALALESATGDVGLGINGEALLPFLLAARVTACSPASRPVFAEGLASSYEAFLQTRNIRRGDAQVTDEEDDVQLDSSSLSIEAQWYLDRLSATLSAQEGLSSTRHPKVAATVERATALWLRGEKVCVFCHYLVTGRILRRHISDSIAMAIREEGSRQLGIAEEQAEAALNRIGSRFFDQDSPIRRACDEELTAILRHFPSLDTPEWRDVVRRNLRTPASLVRYFPLGQDLNADAMRVALDKTDGSGVALRTILTTFFEMLDQRCGAAERERYLLAMQAIQTGERVSSSNSLDDEQHDAERERLLPAVRLVNGQTKQETRQRLMLAFNTPFAPDVLIASNVMAEGVDLHLSCRTMIHHDLSWNPSNLEQRTGRIDRIGAKAERCGRPIDIYLPYVSETQDEKMYRVVMDRERWFNVIMGEKYEINARATDRVAERVPFPEFLADSLRLRLEVP